MPTVTLGPGLSLGGVERGVLNTLTGAAASYGSQAAAYARDLVNGISGLELPLITPVFPTVGDAPALTTTTPPEMAPIVFDLPSLPVPFTGSLTIGDYLPAPFDDNPPEMVFGTAPAVLTDTLPTAPTIDVSFDYPDLNLTLPAPPDLLSLTIVPFGGLDLPTLDYTVPVLTAVEPSLVNYVAGSGYASALLTLVKSSLQDRIENGGTGLSAAAEDAIWDRGREREARAKADAIQSLERMESMGFAYPPGVYLDARLKIETESEATARGLSREIMIKQAELEVANVMKSLELAQSLEAKLIDQENNAEQRNFEAAKYGTEAGIAIYNAKVNAYAAYADAYKAKVQAYEAEIRGEIAKVDAYKAQISAEEAKAQVNIALVNQYKVQADVALANVEVFKAEISAIQSRAEIEKLKVQIFGEEVRGYTAKIGAYTAGVEGYKAQISAEATKQDAFKSQVQAYSAQVEAGVKQIEAQISAYRAQIEAKSSEYDGYKAAAAAEAARAQAIASSNQSLADAYKGEVAANSAYNDAITKQWQAALDQSQRVVEIGVAAAKANAEMYISVRSLSLDAAKVGAQVFAQLGAAAYSGLNYSQSISESESDSYSQQYIETRSLSV